MNKKELNTIMNTYKGIYNAQTVLKIDKSDTIREFKFMLYTLGLRKEVCQVENEVIAERDNMKSIEIEMYSLIFDTFAKYNRFVHYDLSEIEECYDNLQYEMTEEENKCHKARIDYINTHRAA